MTSYHPKHLEQVLHLEGTNMTAALTVDLCPPKLWDDNCLLLKSPCFSYVILAIASQLLNALSHLLNLLASCLSLYHSRKLWRPGKMVQWLKALAGLPRDPGSDPSTHTVAYNYL